MQADMQLVRPGCVGERCWLYLHENEEWRGEVAWRVERCGEVRYCVVRCCVVWCCMVV